MKSLLRILAVMILAGCAPRAPLSADTLPKPFELTLRMVTNEQQATYFKLFTNGEFDFSGGREAFLRLTSSIGNLTDQQMLAVWQLICREKLLDAQSTHVPSDAPIRYEFDLRAGTQNKHLRAADNDLPGLTHLHQLLYDYQIRMRYHSTFQSIDSGLKKN